MTEYAEVTGEDRDVAAFVAAHSQDINLFRLPVKMWVAREDDDETACKEIVAVLMLSTYPYLCLDLIVRKPETRPFMRIMRLWLMAEDWLKFIGAPAVAVSILDTNPYYQCIIRRLGFEPSGVEYDANGNAVETVFVKQLRSQPLAEMVH
jgi:hypothetical protein